MTITSFILSIAVALIVCIIFDICEDKTINYEWSGFCNIMKVLTPVAVVAFWVYVDVVILK